MRTLSLVLFVIFLLFRSLAWGGDNPTLHVMPLDPNFDASKMKGPGVVIDTPPKSTLPSPKLRDQKIAEAGLADATQKWDELARDLFWMRAKSSPKRLGSFYPTLPQAKLKKFAALVHEASKETPK